MNLKRTYKRENRKIMWKFLQYVGDNAKVYLILLIIFFIGIILGVFFVNNADQSQAEQIGGYINSFVNSIKENGYQISKTDILYQSIKNNVIIALVLWFLGCTVIGVPIIYLIIAYKGYCIGYTVSAIIASIGIGKGILFVFSTMLTQNIIYIPIILTLAVSGINLHKRIIEDKRGENIKLQIAKHTIISLCLLGVLFFESFVEAYISGGLSTVFIKFC